MSGVHKWVLYNGERMRLTDAVRAAGSLITLENARTRITKLGWSVERAVTTDKIEGSSKLDPAVKREREVARWREKSKQRKVQRRAAKAAAIVAQRISKTTPAYRKLLRPMAEMSKNELRAMLSQAVKNTAALTDKFGGGA